MGGNRNGEGTRTSKKGEIVLELTRKVGGEGVRKKGLFLWRIMKNIISKTFVSLPIAGEVSTRKFKEDTTLQSYKSLNRRVKPGSAGKRHVYKPKQPDRKQTRWKM